MNQTTEPSNDSNKHWYNSSIKRIIFYILWFFAWLWSGAQSIAISPSSNQSGDVDVSKRNLLQIIWWTIDVIIGVGAGILAFNVMHAKLLSMHIEGFGGLIFLPLLPLSWGFGFALYLGVIGFICKLSETSYWRLIVGIFVILLYIG